MPQQGYLVISDIRGYSQFLNKSELEHARESLSDLLNILVEQTRSPLRVVKLEGDAVFSYAPAQEVETADVLTEMIDDCYIAFRRALRLMVINTNCVCKACRLLPTLDLKFFVHYGSYARQDVANHEDLVGNDVNLIHRLMKNSVSEETGLEAYVAYTEPAVEELTLDQAVDGFIPHSESYDDVGQVVLSVKDMHGVSDNSNDKLRIRVTEEDAIGLFEMKFELPPEEMWAYITDPVTLNMLLFADWQKLEPGPQGVADVGAAYVCAHGGNKVLHTIVDWKPPTFYTVRAQHLLPDVSQLGTFELKPEAEGCRLRLLFSGAQGPFLWRQVWNLVTSIAPGLFSGILEKKVQLLRQRIRLDKQGLAMDILDDAGS